MKRLGKETKSVEESIQLGESAWYLQQLGESALPKRRPAPTLVVWSTSPSRRRPDRLGVGPEIRVYLTTGSQRERTSLLQKPAQRTGDRPSKRQTMWRGGQAQAAGRYPRLMRHRRARHRQGSRQHQPGRGPRRRISLTTRNPCELMPTAARRTPRRETAARVEPEEFRDIIQPDHPEDAHQYLVAKCIPRSLGHRRPRAHAQSAQQLGHTRSS